MRLFPLAVLAVASCLAVGTAWADAGPSLFFTDAERAAIEVLQKALPLAEVERRENVLSLEAILYLAPRNWTIWISGRRYGPDTPAQAFVIERVTPSDVTLRLKNPQAGDEKGPIALHPRESYRRGKGRVWRGG